jgi:hypothetical protein
MAEPAPEGGEDGGRGGAGVGREELAVPMRGSEEQRNGLVRSRLVLAKKKQGEPIEGGRRRLVGPTRGKMANSPVYLTPLVGKVDGMT